MSSDNPISAVEKQTHESELHELQTPFTFQSDFIQHAHSAQQEIKGVVLQIESSEHTNPIYESMLAARQRGVDVELVYDPASVGHVSRRDEKGDMHEGNLLHGRIIRHSGNKEIVRQADRDRSLIISRLTDANILQGQNLEKAGLGVAGHNHIKLFFVDGVAWIGSMNLRESDFEMSNFMMKTTDPATVTALKQIYNMSISSESNNNNAYQVSDNTEVLYDSGIRNDSLIYDRALSMISSLSDGDEVTLIGQYPPVNMMYGSLLKALKERMQIGVDVEFLMPPEDSLHPVEVASKGLQWIVTRKASRNPNMRVHNLNRKTHVKALIIKRKDGTCEVLFGSHNLTSWTVGIGNKEVAMHSSDPIIVDQIDEYVTALKSES